MHVSALSVDLNWFVQFVITAFVIVFGLLHVVKNTASKYFVVDANFEGGGGGGGAGDSVALVGSPESDHRSRMPGVSRACSGDACAVCGEFGTKKCSGCKLVRYCSGKCQIEHWRSGHKKTCKGTHHGMKASGFGGSSFTKIQLVPDGETSKTLKQSKKILFPYGEFVKIFNWDKPGFSPCGLLNCGNSCYANVVLQCLTYTRPLVAYLLEKGHRRECRLNDWCFLCEFEAHLVRASRSLHPFSPINILSRLPNIGGNLGYGKQEDAHEFMRFAIDTMQSVCLAEFGGEKAVHPSSQETTLIQHIFGGHLQSQVICTNCNNISNQYENMMDLTVEIQGDAASLEECLDQFTVKEWLHGDNMYKCDGCNDYVKAWKRLTVRQAPNVLTITLKRFESGRYGKLNKRVTFPETLDLSPYMTEAVNGTDVYKLYAVVVHVDLLNASYFGHYICYIKDFRGYWYRINDCKVVDVELEEVLSQGAYMLLYSRVCARPSCLESIEALKKEEQRMVDVAPEVAPSEKPSVNIVATADSYVPISFDELSPTDSSPLSHFEDELSLGTHSEALREDTEDVEMVDPRSRLLVSKEIEVYGNGQSNSMESAFPAEHENRLVSGIVSCSSETSLAEACYLNYGLASSTSDTDDGNSDNSSSVREVVSLNSFESPMPTQNGVCDKAITSDDPSLATISAVEEFQDKVSPVGSNGVCDKAITFESPMPTQNGVCDKAITSDDPSLATISAVEEFQDKVSPVGSNGFSISYPEKLEKNKSGEGSQRSSCTEDTAGKIAGGNSSSEATWKPVFTPVSLGKRPRNKSLKRDENSSQDSGKLAIDCKVDRNCNGFLKRGFLNQKANKTKDQAKAHLNCNGSSASSVQKQLEKCLNEVEMVDINFGESINICSGDANSAIADENTSDSSTSDVGEKNSFCVQINDYFVNNGVPSVDTPLAEKSLVIDGEVHECRSNVHSGTNGTSSKKSG